ncbi:MAG: ABC-F family ATP-binding cassette domain-containing protein, partial [Chloroflexia bacterium]
MFQVQNLHKSYGTATVLAGVNFVVNDGEHVGLIGPNGSGKTTLLKIITGRERADSGAVVLQPRHMRVGYLAQAFEQTAGLTVGEAIHESQAELANAERAMQRAADALAQPHNLEDALRAYEEASARFEALGGYERTHVAEAIMQGLSLGDISPETEVRTLSGGQKTRLGLALLLLQEPDLLLLDEPTNHLDVEALEWLEGFVQGYRKSVIVVSHDREFLDRTVTRVLYLDPEAHITRSYEGNYTDFEEAREREHVAHVETWKRQQAYIERTRQDIQAKKSSALSLERSTTPRQPGLRVLARKKAAVAKSRERKLDRYLESDDRVEKPKAQWWLKLDFGQAPAGGRSVLRVDDVSFSYGDEGRKTKDEGNGEGNGELLITNYEMGERQSAIRNPQSEILHGVSFDVQYGDRVALVGPNGAGKTTLLRLIEGKLQPASGTIKLGANVRLGVLSQEQETLQSGKTVLDTALEERSMHEAEARNFLHFFLFDGDDVFRKTEECSLGERTRLQLALLVLRGCNLLLLDEPLNHLDIDGRAHFEAALEAYEGTVIAVAHDRAFLRHYPERVIEVRDGHTRVFEGGYEDYLRHKGQG